MKQLNNEKGLTLLEMLATITILMIIGGIVGGIFFQMFTYFKNSENRIAARQEANLIIAHLTTIHQKSKKYTIEYESEHYFITVANYEDGETHTMKLGHKNYQYELVVDATTISSSVSRTIEPKDKDQSIVPIQLTLESDNGHDKFTVTTTLSRLKIENTNTTY